MVCIYCIIQFIIIIIIYLLSQSLYRALAKHQIAPHTYLFSFCPLAETETQSESESDMEVYVDFVFVSAGLNFTFDIQGVVAVRMEPKFNDSIKIADTLLKVSKAL